MSVYGYIHAPIGSHDYHTQYYTILSFSSNTPGQVNFCYESGQDQLDADKPILFGMIDNFQREDVLVVTDFVKLGISTAEVLKVLSTLSRIGVKAYVVNAGFRLDDNVQAQKVATAYSLVSQIDQELISSRTIATQMQDNSAERQVDIPAPRTRRSMFDGMEDQIRSLLAENLSIAEISRRLGGVNRQTLNDFISRKI